MVTTFRPPFTVFVAHSDDSVRRWLIGQLDGTEVEVVGQADNGIETMVGVREAVPSVAALAVDLPGIDGIRACAQVRGAVPACQVLLLVPSVDDRSLAGIDAGALGCWVTANPSLALDRALRGTMRRAALLPPAWAKELIARYDGFAADGGPALSPDEQAVLEVLAAGATHDQAAELLELTCHLVRRHAGNALVRAQQTLADRAVTAGATG